MSLSTQQYFLRACPSLIFRMNGRARDCIRISDNNKNKSNFSIEMIKKDCPNGDYIPINNIFLIQNHAFIQEEVQKRITFS